jgi:hypothetical protein
MGAYLPNTKETDEQVTREASSEHLRNDEDVGGEGALEHDRHIGGVKEFDWVTSPLSSEPVALDGNFDPESLEVDDDDENNDSSNEVHHIRQSFSPESLTKCAAFVVPSEQQME